MPGTTQSPSSSGLNWVAYALTTENKYKNLEDRASELKGQELVNLRIRQLSIVKVVFGVTRSW
jgi:hypothetical protein